MSALVITLIVIFGSVGYIAVGTALAAFYVSRNRADGEEVVIAVLWPFCASYYLGLLLYAAVLRCTPVGRKERAHLKVQARREAEMEEAKHQTALALEHAKADELLSEQLARLEKEKERKYA